MRHLSILAALAACAAPAAAQTRTDTLAVHPGDTVAVIVPATCPLVAGSSGERRCWLNVQGPTTTYLQHSLLRITPRPVTPPPVIPPPVVQPPPVTPPPSTFPTPDVVSESFESGWGLFDNGGGSPPTGVTRDQTRAADGVTAVRRAFSPNSGDAGSGFTLPFYYKGPARSYDRLWVRFAFYLDVVPTSAFKFVLFWSNGFSDDFGGLYLHSGRDLTWSFLNEWNGSAARLADVTALVGGWHTVEMDYWRNGDPSGNPSVAFWLDGQAITTGGTAGTGRWVNGRLDAGSRSAGYGGRKLGALRPMSTLNGGNTATGNVWMDRIQVSSLGRIGP